MALDDDKHHHQLRLAADLVPNLVDKRAVLTPDHVYAEYPVSAHSYDQGFRKITYTLLANAVNGVAWWLHQTLGPSQVFETLTYIGPNDIRYPALILGAVKAGYVVRTPELPKTARLMSDAYGLLADILDISTQQHRRASQIIRSFEMQYPPLTLISASSRERHRKRGKVARSRGP